MERRCWLSIFEEAKYPQPSRNRLKYAITMKEVETIMKQRLIKIDGKTRTDTKFPTESLEEGVKARMEGKIKALGHPGRSDSQDGYQFFDGLVADLGNLPLFL